MRDYDVTVVSDCCAARTPKEHGQAIEHIRTMADARIVTSGRAGLDKLKSSTGSKNPQRRGDGR